MVLQLLNIPVLDFRPLLQRCNVFRRCCTCLRLCLLWRAEVPVVVSFVQGGSTLVFLVDRFLLCTENFPDVFLGEDLHGLLPQLVVALFIVFQELVIVEAAQIHMANEEYGLVHVRDLHREVGALELLLIELRGKLCDVFVGGVRTGGLEVVLHIYLLRVGDGEPRAQLGKIF